MDKADIKGEKRRPRFKKQIFTVFFSKVEHMETRAARAFQAEFPNVFAAIIEAKQNRYEQLAWDLQRIESGLVIDWVAARCLADLPRDFTGTIYDSILVVPGLVERVSAIMREEFARIGLRPTIRVEPLVRPPSHHPDCWSG